MEVITVKKILEEELYLAIIKHKYCLKNYYKILEGM